MVGPVRGRASKDRRRPSLASVSGIFHPGFRLRREFTFSTFPKTSTEPYGLTSPFELAECCPFNDAQQETFAGQRLRPKVRDTQRHGNPPANAVDCRIDGVLDFAG
jgi:hypothetical protein